MTTLTASQRHFAEAVGLNPDDATSTLRRPENRVAPMPVAPTVTPR